MTDTKKHPTAANGGVPRDSAANRKLEDQFTELPELRTDFAVHVVSTRADGVQVGQTFATLAAAERKMQRQELRGLPARMTLVRLVPVPWSVGGGAGV